MLHRLRLAVPAGQTTVLMGPSGAGKSTLVDHLAGLLRPSRGRVVIGDEDVWELDRAALTEMRRGMSVMLGGSSLYEASTFASLSVLDNVCYSLRVHGVPERERRERAMEELRGLNLAGAAQALPGELPAHARKRVALARALATDSPLTVLDEIDAGVDADHLPLILSAVRELRARTCCTLLVTTHSITLAHELADRLAILCNARIVAEGDPADLLDGVRTAEEFDERFRISDFVGPPRLEDIENSGEDKTRRFSVTIDPQVVIPLVVGMVLVIVLAAFYLLRPHIGAP